MPRSLSFRLNPDLLSQSWRIFDDPISDSVKTPHWDGDGDGMPNADGAGGYAYGIRWVGQGTTHVFSFHDDRYDDNYGNLLVEIWGPPPTAELDVNNDGDLDDVGIDLTPNYLPGYVVSMAALTTLAPQMMNIIVQGVIPGTLAHFELEVTTSHPGIATNKNADNPALNSGPDYELTDGSTGIADASGQVIMPIRCKDFGGATTVKITVGPVVLRLKLPVDADNDQLADKWELEESGDLATFGRDTDEDDNEGGAGAHKGDRFAAFDEYRGFFIRGTHTRTEPHVKDLFVHSPDSDPYLADMNNEDGLNTDRALGQPVEVGQYSTQLHATIHLIDEGEFNAGAGAGFGDVNFNSPFPYNNIRQKRVWVITESELRHEHHGAVNYPLPRTPTRGPNALIAQPDGEGPATNEVAAILHLGMIRTDIAFIDGDGVNSGLGSTPAIFLMQRGRSCRRLDLHHLL